MKVVKTVYLVTHGEKENGPNPGMTSEGIKRVAALRPKLDELLSLGPSEIHCGTGRRHIDVFKALNFPITGIPITGVFSSDLWGSPASLEKIAGIKIIILADGTIVDWDHYKTIEHLGRKVISRVIAGLSHNALICSGRPVLVRLGLKPEECQNGALYALHVMEDGSIEIELLVSGVNLLDKDGSKV